MHYFSLWFFGFRLWWAWARLIELMWLRVLRDFLLKSERNLHMKLPIPYPFIIYNNFQIVTWDYTVYILLIMPSNLAPEIIVTVQNPDPDQCDTTTSGSLESEDCGKSNSSSNNILTSKSTVRLKSCNEDTGKTNSPTPLKDRTSGQKTKVKSKHRHSNGENKSKIIRKDSKATITTAIDMVEGKPRLWVSPRKSASAVRVQVTLHRPLNWQVVSSASTCTGSVPTKLVKQSSSSSKSTVTHSHSLSQSESLSFSISPSASILSAPNKCHSRNNFLQHHKGKVRFTELPRSRLGKHIEKIDNKELMRERGNTVSESLCYCQCAFSGDRRQNVNNDDEKFLSRSVFPTIGESSPYVFLKENVNETEEDDIVDYSGGGGNNSFTNFKPIQYRRKKSRSVSTRRRATSYHDGDRSPWDPTCTSSSDSEGTEIIYNLFFQ